MGLAHSPKIVTDGLVFYADMNNTSKSWRGKPATNFLTNGHFSNGNGVTQESGSNATNEIIPFPNPGSSDYVLRQTGTVPFTEYQLNLTTELVSGLTYVMSGWYGESSNYSSADGSRMFHSAAFSTSGANASLGIGIGTVLETKVVNGITWRYCYATITTPADYNNVFHWYLGYGSNAYTGYRYYTDLQVEIGTFPSRFVNGTRFNTQALLDLTKRNTITATSLTYPVDGTFSFNGTSNYFAQNSPVSLPTTQDSTVLVWCKPDSTGPTDQYTGLVSYGSRSVTTPSNSRLLSLYTSGTTMFVSSAFWGNDYTPNSLVVNANQWNMVGMISRAAGTVNNVTLYSGLNSQTGSSSFYTRGLNTTLANFAIGVTDYPARYFKGSIDKVMIFDRELTVAEITQIYNATRGKYGI